MKIKDEQGLRRKLGDLNAFCGWKEYRHLDGPAAGLRAFDLNNGRGLNLTVLADRGLDISSLTYKGRQAAFLSKTRPKHPAYYTEDGARGFLRQFYAGLLTTCGLTHAGAAFSENGQSHGLHGPFSNTPASRVAVRMEDRKGAAVIRLYGEIRQSEVFGDHLVLKREMEIETEKDVIRIRDTVENQGFFESPLMLVYHVNFGYPLLDAGARVYTSAGRVKARDDIAQAGLARWNEMEEPSAKRPEECFFHTAQPREAFAMVHNPVQGFACAVDYDSGALPLLCEWKCMREGDYALGLEPTTSGVMGQPAARKDGSLILLQPGESRVFELSLLFTDSKRLINSYIARSGENKTT